MPRSTMPVDPARAVMPTDGSEMKSAVSAIIDSASPASTAAPTGGPITLIPRAPRKAGRGRKVQVAVTPALSTQIASMVAAGGSVAQVARAVGVSKDSVRRVIRHPDTQDLITHVRATIKEWTLKGVQSTVRDAYTFLKETVQSREAKDFQLVANGLANLERVSSSASGEARKVEQKTEVSGGVDVTAEAKALILALTREG